MTWFDAIGAILFACAVVIGPGLIATAPLRFGVLARGAISGLIGVFITGFAAIAFGSIGLPFALWQVLVVAVISLGITMLVRRAVPRLEARPDRRSLWLAAAWAVSGIIFAFVTFARVPDPDRISQTYDNVFHLSAVSAILDGFSASPLTLRSLIETQGGGIAYYPSAWHSLVALTAQTTGATVPVAFNAVWIAVALCVWIPGIAWLAALLVPNPVAPIVAMPLAVSFGWYPYGLLTWGTIYPTAFAHAILPVTVGVGILATRALLPQDAFSRRWDRAQLRRVGLAAAGLLIVGIALGFAHPRVLPTWVLIGAPYVLWRLGSAYRHARREGGKVARRAAVVVWGTTGVAVLGAAAAFAYAVYGLGLFDEPLSERLNGPQARARQTIWDGIAQVLTLQSKTGVQGIVTAIAPLLALAVVIGVIAAVRRAETRWIVVSYLLIAILFVLASGSDDDVTKLLTGVWYKDGYRLAAALPVITVPLATLGIVSVGEFFASRRAAASAGRPAVAGIAAAALSVGVAVTATSGLALSGVSEATGVVFHEPVSAADREVVSAKQIDFLEDVVPEIVPADQRLLGDPWDGSALSGLYADREPVFPHVNGQWDRNRRVLAWNLELIEKDPEVCHALDALNVQYVLYNPHAFGGGDPAGNHFPAPHQAVEAGLFEQVATDGESVLYRITECET